MQGRGCVSQQERGYKEGKGCWEGREGRLVAGAPVW
jgi:hypothetical protein